MGQHQFTGILDFYFPQYCSGSFFLTFSPLLRGEGKVSRVPQYRIDGWIEVGVRTYPSKKAASKSIDDRRKNGKRILDTRTGWGKKEIGEYFGLSCHLKSVGIGQKASRRNWEALGSCVSPDSTWCSCGPKTGVYAIAVSCIWSIYWYDPWT